MQASQPWRRWKRDRSRTFGHTEKFALGRARFVGLATIRAEQAHETLGEQTDQARGEQERFHAHVVESGDRADGGVGVQGGEHKVAGERGLHGDLGGFEVADFADHHHVRILAQDRAQPAREGHLHPRVDLRLADAVNVVFDRILHRHDVAARVVQTA